MRTDPQTWRIPAPFSAMVLTIAAALLVTACSDGDDDEGPTPPPPATTVTGTAAMGAPLANVTVTLKDSSGKSATAKSAADGSFSIVTTGLTPPYLLQVPAGGSSLYAVSADKLTTTTINVTTLTDLVTRTWFTVNGAGSIDSVFQNPAGAALPAPSQVEVVEELFDGVFRIWLTEAGIDPDKSNTISTPFKADGTGMDLVLEETSVNGQVITITGVVRPTSSAKPARSDVAALATEVTRTQVSTLAIDNSAKTVTVESTVAAEGVVSETVVTTVVPTSTTMENAIAGINANLEALADTANAKKHSITSADLLPYLDPELLQGGGNRQQIAELFAAQLKLEPLTVTESAYLVSLDQLDVANGTAHGYWASASTEAGQTSANKMESRFRLVDGKWLLSGDGRIGEIDLELVTTHVLDSRGLIWPSGPRVEVGIETPKDSVTGISVSGGPWANIEVPFDYTWTDEAGHEIDNFWMQSDILEPGDIPPAGTPFTFKLQPASGEAITYTLGLNTISSDGVRFIANLGNLNDVAGKPPVTAQWTLPQTYAVFQLRGGFYAASRLPDGSYGPTCEQEVWPLDASATSMLVAIPAECEGYPVIVAELWVSAEGVTGEISTSVYGLHGAP